MGSAQLEPNLAALVRKRWLARLMRGFADVIVPPVCLSCRRRVADVDAICAGCWREIAFIRSPLCDRLGVPLPFGGDGTLVSAAAAADPPIWSRARAVALYESGGPMARMIASMKYHDKHDARRLFGRWLADAGRELLRDADLIVPVPLTRWRLLRRQFNQAAVVSREVSRLTGVTLDAHSLVKIRTTTPQVELTGAARRQNLRGAFRVARGRETRVAGRRIVLVDDVVTTGATAEACTRALMAAGALSVDVLALARSPAVTSVSP